MKKLALALSFAFVATTALADNHGGGDPLSCSISCAQEYNQCMREGVDLSLASSPSEGGSRISSNMSAASGCLSDSIQCNKGCLGG